MTDLCDAYELHAEIMVNNCPFSVGESYIVKLSLQIYDDDVVRPVSHTGGHDVKVQPGPHGYGHEIRVYYRDEVNGDLLTSTIYADTVDDQRVAKCNAKPQNPEKDVKNVTKGEDDLIDELIATVNMGVSQ